jgi:hypothetical protein
LIYAISAVFGLALQFQRQFSGNRLGLLFWRSGCCSRFSIGSGRNAARSESGTGGNQRPRFLRRIARETWRYFDDLVGPEHNWLPPDNSQEALRIEVAVRTSPTNIGLWLMSAVSARDLGFLTPEAMADRCTATIETLESWKLARVTFSTGTTPELWNRCAKVRIDSR